MSIGGDEYRERSAASDLQKALVALLREALPQVEPQLAERIQQKLDWLQDREDNHGGWLT